MVLAFLLPPLASAQVADVHGAIPPTPSGDPADPVLVWAPPAGVKGEWAVTALGQAIDNPAVLYRVEGGVVTPFTLIDLAIGVDVGVRWSPIGPLGLAVTMPVFPVVIGDPDTDSVTDAAPALGDLRFALPLAIVPRADREGFGLGAVPYVTLPTGAQDRYVGEPELTAGVVAAGGVRAGRLAVDANAGLERLARVDRGVQVRGSLEVPVGLSVGARLAGGLSTTRPSGRGVWARLETRGGFDVLGTIDEGSVPDEVGTPGVPFEVLATATARFGSTTAWLGGGRGVTDGIGAANVRAIGGVGWARLVEPAGDGEVLAPRFVFKVLDPHGVPVDGVDVLVGGEPIGRTDTAGELAVDDVKWGKGVALRAPRFVDTAVQKPADPDAMRVEVTLPWEPAKVEAAVSDVEGKPLDVTITATSLDDPEKPPVTGKPGEVELVPGRWRIELTAPGMGKQVREIVVEPTGRPPDPLEAVLLADQGGTGGTEIRVTDPEGRPIEEARVLVDGLLVGTTADGGLVALGGLKPGPHTVEVQHEAFTASEPMEVAVGDATVAVPVALQRVPGSVRIVVRGPNGVPVTDAVARFLGPRRLAPMALGEDGDRIQVLGPGEWTLIVSSGKYGVQEREVVVPEGRYELITVEIVLQPSEAGEAELVLRVVGPDGKPVEGVEVLLDDRPLGSTSTGGTLTLPGLAPGPRSLVVRAQGLRPLEPVPVLLVSGIQERLQTVEWQEGTVDVVVRGPTGPVADARVRFLADAGEDLPAASIGPTGRQRLSVPPGSWTAQATSAALGIQERDLLIPAGSNLLQVVEFVLAPVEGGLAELSVRVVDPEGRPVEGARVSLDGEDVGTTANAGTLRLQQLTMGRREVRVSAAPFAEAVQKVRLLEGSQDLELALDWGTGAVKVRVRNGDAPVTDAVVRMLGDDVRPPIPVDPVRGEVLTQVTPGLWLVLASSPSLGIAEWDLEVKPDAVLSEVTLDMRPTATDRTDLVVRIVDPDGEAVEHAKVTLDGASAGETQQGGVVLARGLVPGTVQVRVEAPDYAAAGPLPIELAPGLVERVIELPWLEIPVTVRTVSQDGAAVDAKVQWVGPGDVDELRSGPQGRVEAKLRPGDWQVVATAGDLAADGRLTVRLADEPRPLDLVLTPTRAVLSGEEVLIKEMVQFDFNQATLRADSGPVLDEVARVLLSLPKVVRLEVQGHTDTIGAVPVNQALSQARAEAVVAALVTRGVPPEKLLARGYGPTKPIDTNDTDEGRAKNRRVQFEIVEKAAG